MEFVLGGAASCGAVLFTNPLEVVKTRFQLQGELQAKGKYTKTYRNVVHAIFTVARNDGLRGLQKGLTPALMYQFSINSVKRGLYQGFVTAGFVHRPDGSVSLGASVVAGAVSGCCAACVGSPMYMIKTQLQSSSKQQIAVGYQHNHTNCFQAFRKVFAKHGFKGLWRGWSALCARLMFGSTAELTSFLIIKEFLHKQNLFEQGTMLNAIAASSLSGVAVVMAITPFDVMATRMYNQPIDSQGKGLLYRNLVNCAGKIMKEEGLLGFYKGVTASFCRVAPHVCLSLFFWEKLRQVYCKKESVGGRELCQNTDSNSYVAENCQQLDEFLKPTFQLSRGGGLGLYCDHVGRGLGEHLEYTQPF